MSIERIDRVTDSMAVNCMVNGQRVQAVTANSSIRAGHSFSITVELTGDTSQMSESDLKEIPGMVSSFIDAQFQKAAQSGIPVNAPAGL